MCFRNDIIWSVASLSHKEFMVTVATQWPFEVQSVCFSFGIKPSSHATHSEPSRLTNWFGASPAHNKSQSVSAEPLCTTRTVCLGHGPPHLMQDCLSSAGIVPGLHFLHVPVSPALPCPASATI